MQDFLHAGDAVVSMFFSTTTGTSGGRWSFDTGNRRSFPAGRLPMSSSRSARHPVLQRRGTFDIESLMGMPTGTNKVPPRSTSQSPGLKRGPDAPVQPRLSPGPQRRGAQSTCRKFVRGARRLRTLRGHDLHRIRSSSRSAARRWTWLLDPPDVVRKVTRQCHQIYPAGLRRGARGGRSSARGSTCARRTDKAAENAYLRRLDHRRRTRGRLVGRDHRVGARGPGHLPCARHRVCPTTSSV